jgi:nickel-dependent lactate racemase
METELTYRSDRLAFSVPSEKCVQIEQAGLAASLVDPVAALRRSLEDPWEFPALRQALTPEDHVAVVLDTSAPQVELLLPATIEHVLSAGVRAENITIVVPGTPAHERWREALRPWDDSIKVEIHDPNERDKLRYLAATRAGRRVYLNRTVVDAEQVVVLARRGFDWARGGTGMATAVFPTLSDHATLVEYGSATNLYTDGLAAKAFRAEAEEAVWLLGAPFFIQVIEGPGDSIGSIVTGVIGSAGEGRRLRDRAWRLDAGIQGNLVIVSVTGSPERLGLEDLTAAAAKASSFVEPGGSLVMLFPATVELDEGMQIILDADSPAEALKTLHKQHPAHASGALEWLSAVGRCHVYVLSPIAAETIEALLAVPLDKLQQVQKLVDSSSSVLFLIDAQKLVSGVKRMGAVSKPPESGPAKSKARRAGSRKRQE